MNQGDIKQQIRAQALHNADQRGITYKEDPAWISVISWWIGGIMGVMFTVIMLLAEKNTRQPIEMAVFIVSGITSAIMFKAISHIILVCLFHGGKIVKQGAVAATKEGSKLLDDATSAVAKKITIAVERGEAEAKIEQEKQRLKEQITDLELQQLRKRVEELEKQVDNK